MVGAILTQKAIILVGDNSFGHPTSDALGRLHAHGVRTYWTNIGDRVSPDQEYDRVAGSIVLEVLPATYSVSGDGYQNE